MAAILQISDTHFGTERPPVLEALLRLNAQLLPELVVLSGDITQRARSSQFRAARAFVDRLHTPRLVVPGNHDIPLLNLWGRITRPYAGFRAAFGEQLEPLYNSPDLMVLCVNTTRPMRHKNGEVSMAQLDRVAWRLKQATPTQLRVVVVHQPIDVQREEDLPNRLIGHAAAQRAWAAAGADLIMGGHIHLPYVMPLSGLARPMWAVQAGTAMSRRVRAGMPNSVNVVHWNAAQQQCAVEQWDYAAEQDAFVRALVTPLQPAH